MVLAKRSRQGLRTLDDIVNHFKKGYELIHRIRELLTSQEITYSVLYATRQHKDGYKPLFEAHLTLDQVLAETRPAYKDIQTVNVDTEFSNVLSLEFANADARRAVDAAEKQGGSSISNALDKRDLWDTLIEYAEANHPNANRGRLYEVYSTLVKTPRYQKINYIGHHKGQANTEGLASALIKQALADRDFGWQKGDIALEQLKAVFNANAALIDGSTIKVVLTEIYQALRAQTEQELIDNLTKIFTVKKQQFDLEVDALVKEEAVIAIEKKIKEGKIFDIK